MYGLFDNDKNYRTKKKKGKSALIGVSLSGAGDEGMGQGSPAGCLGRYGVGRGREEPVNVAEGLSKWGSWNGVPGCWLVNTGK